MDHRDGEGFEHWYRREHPRLLLAIAAATGSVEIAADAVDEALSRALACWDQIDVPAAWVYRVALNVAQRRARRAGVEQKLFRRVAISDSLPGPAGELWLLVAALPRRQRLAVVLRHVGQLTEPEIAEAMGIRRGTVSATLRFGLSVVAGRDRYREKGRK